MVKKKTENPKQGDVEQVAPNVDQVFVDTDEPETLPAQPRHRVERSLYYKPKKPVRPECKEYFKNYKPPKFAYVLVETVRVNLERQGDSVIKTVSYRPSTVNVEYRPMAGAAKVQYLIDEKQGRIIDWGNFPSLNDENPQRAQLARMHYNVDTKTSDYTTLLNWIKQKVTQQEIGHAQNLQLRQQLEESEQERKAMEKKIAELQKKQSAQGAAA